MENDILLVGKEAPDFSLPNQNGDLVKLSDFRGMKVVLFFYPKDMTSGCTVEACDFRDRLAEFNELNVVVLGVSPDDEKSHQKFIEKEGLTFDLLADTEKEACQAYSVWQEKSMYGKKYMGVNRSTFLIDENGVVQKEWRNVKVPGHVTEVREQV